MSPVAVTSQRPKAAAAVPVNIAISADDNTISVIQGQTGVVRYTITRTNYTGVVTPTASGLPANVTVAFSPTTFTGATTYIDATYTVGASATPVTADAFSVDFAGSGISTVTDNGTITVVSSGGVTHYGTATLPTVTPTYTSTNTYTAGTVHTPTTPAELNTLLTGGSLGGFTLAAGDTIVLARGTCYNNATYTRHIFPYISGAESNPILVITSGTASIAAPDDRITAAQRHATPHFRCQSGNVECLLVDGGSTTRGPARGYRFVGIQIDAGSVTAITGVVRVGPFPNKTTYSSGTTYALNDLTYGGWYSLQNGNIGNPQVEGAWWTKMDSTDLPDDIVFDRCDIAALNYTNNAGVVFYASHRELVVVNSILFAEGAAGVEDKAYLAVTAVGPLLFENNQCTSSSIPFLVGGATPYFPTVPENYTVRRNWFYKPTYMLASHVDWDSKSRNHKNSFEFKTMRYALVENNLFENHFDGSASQYFAVVFKCSNQDNAGFPEAETAHITFRYNRLKNINGAFGLGAVDLVGVGATALGCHDFSIYQNYTETLMGLLNANGAGHACRGVQISNGASPVPYNFHFEHLTLLSDPRQESNFPYNLATNTANGNGMVLRNAILSYGEQTYRGINKDANGNIGTDAFNGTGSDVQAVYLYDPQNSTLPSGKYASPPMYRKTVAADLFVNYASSDFHTAAALAGVGYNSETPGADVDTIDTFTAGCATGAW